jgi:hypothetical protein
MKLNENENFYFQIHSDVCDARRGQVQGIIAWSEAVPADAGVQLLSGFRVVVVAAIGARVHSSIESLTRKNENKFTFPSL